MSAVPRDGQTDFMDDSLNSRFRGLALWENGEGWRIFQRRVHKDAQAINERSRYVHFAIALNVVQDGWLIKGRP